MGIIDELKNSFGNKLEEIQQQKRSQLAADLETLRSAGMHTVEAGTPQRLAEAGDTLRQWVASRPPIAAQVNLAGSGDLRQLDNHFLNLFKLAKAYPSNLFNYPTVYCETLEEFFTPIFNQIDISPQARQVELARWIEEAQQKAPGGIFGLNLPGMGCYLNGWLFVYGRDIPPRAALQDQELLPYVLATAAHEKLGHGFLSTYSALGSVKTRLGLTQVEIAQKFGLRSADDPVTRLRREQNDLLFLISQLVEEGWATWIETFLSATTFKSGKHPRHSLDAVVGAVKELPSEPGDLRDVQNVLLWALSVLFVPQDVPLEALHQAVQIIDLLGSKLDEFFMTALRQPLRYAVGELLLTQAEANLGWACVPYVVLAAANVSFDPKQIGLSDLRELILKDPRLHPDARLAALSRIHLETPGSVSELARRAESELSFSVPLEFNN